ncbi:NfeD family protein [Sphingomonas crusticola]|uniref:NfeD family protein n=1 Tax=Sphingomonas crusticola TaxID=1697973 RepID=UPI000E254726|nr:NfeD family protein [Sphingomonas crusticola]
MGDAWLWLIAGVALAIAELIVPGVFLIWLGAAALVTGTVTLALPLAAPVQFAVFAISACLAVLGGRSVMRRSPIISDDPLLNERTARLIGKRVMVVEPLIGGEGRVRVGDGVWSAIGTDAPAGTLVEVIGADGGRLVVEPIPPQT